MTGRQRGQCERILLGGLREEVLSALKAGIDAFLTMEYDVEDEAKILAATEAILFGGCVDIPAMKIHGSEFVTFRAKLGAARGLFVAAKDGGHFVDDLLNRLLERLG